ncbi:MAG: AAA family ATPase [Bacteroidetes bacterium]|nr:AAA family ATPase [Bacteroidota bacterium]
MLGDKLSDKALIILRGLPGSGKSTLANVLSENGKYPIASIDDFFTDSETGNYHFEFDKNYLAYKQCELRVKESMQLQHSKIIVHNTFTLEWEMEPYFKLAMEFNYSLFVVTVENRHNGKNIHGIGEEQLQKMAAKYHVCLLPSV